MEKLPESSVLKFNKDTLESVRKSHGFKSASDINKSIDLLEEWIMKQPHFTVKEFDRSYLERIIIRSKGSVERAKKRLDTTCTMRTLLPNFFGDFDINTDFYDVDNILYQILTPRLDKDNNRVFIFKCWGTKVESKKITLLYIQQVLMIVDYLTRNDCVNSYIAVLDYRETNLIELCTKLDILDLRQAVTFVTDAYGMRIKSINIISPSKVVDMVVSLFKQIFSAKIAERINVHKTLDTLYDHIDRDILPVEYGGKEEAGEIIMDNWRKELSQKRERELYKRSNATKTDESLRQSAKFNEQYMGMPGSFRTLSVD